MKRIPVQTLGYVLAVLGACLTAVWAFPPARQERVVEVALTQVLERSTPAERTVLEEAGLSAAAGACLLEVRMTAPGLMLAGKRAGISAELVSDCGLQMGLRARVQEDARLVQPAGEISARDGKLAWTIQPVQAGHWEGTVWAYLDLQGTDAGSEPILLAVVPLTMRSFTLVGLSDGQVLWAGLGSCLAGVAVSILSRYLAGRKKLHPPGV